MKGKEVEFAKKKTGKLSEQPEQTNKIMQSGFSQVPCDVTYWYASNSYLLILF